MHPIKLITFFALTFSTSAFAAIADFENITLPGSESANVAGSDIQFSSGGVTFNQDWNETFDCCATGWFASNYTDTTTPGFLNQYSAITGSGVNGSLQYGVANLGNADIDFDIASNVDGLYVTNTTYTYLAIQNGDDGNSPAFVKGPFDSTDFFTLTISGFDTNDNLIGAVDVALWNASLEQALAEWLWVDLSSLGVVSRLDFNLDSSDSGQFGLNTPAYFAIDDLSYQPVPLPAATWLLLSALTSLFVTRQPS